MAENRYKTALEIQDACNLTAVAGVLHKVCLEVLHESESTDAVTKDPAVILIVDKIHDMCGRLEGQEFSKAFIACSELSEIETLTQRITHA
jgi:hypothetical protein